MIDDDSLIRLNLSESLKFAGFEVLTAADGQSGIRLAETSLPDLILCDIMMPGIDGFQVLKELSAKETTRQIPFLFLTAVADTSDIRLGMALGADDYITKPYRVKELIAAIQARLERIKALKSTFSKEPDKPSEPFPGPNSHSYTQNIILTEAGKPHYVRLSNIAAISADGDYTTVYLIDGKEFYIRRLLGDWDKVLPEANFFRIHRSTVVNLEYIEKIEKWFKRSFKIYMKHINRSFVVSERAAVLLKARLSI